MRDPPIPQPYPAVPPLPGSRPGLVVTAPEVGQPLDVHVEGIGLCLPRVDLISREENPPEHLPVRLASLWGCLARPFCFAAVRKKGGNLRKRARAVGNPRVAQSCWPLGLACICATGSDPVMWGSGLALPSQAPSWSRPASLPRSAKGDHHLKTGGSAALVSLNTSK